MTLGYDAGTQNLAFSTCMEETYQQRPVDSSVDDKQNQISIKEILTINKYELRLGERFYILKLREQCLDFLL